MGIRHDWGQILAQSCSVCMTWDTSQLAWDFPGFKTESPASQESPQTQTGSVGQLRPRANPTAILSFSFHIRTKGGNTYFAKVVGEGNGRMHVNHARRCSTTEMFTHYILTTTPGRQCSAEVPQGGKRLHPAEDMGPPDTASSSSDAR